MEERKRSIKIPKKKKLYYCARWWSFYEHETIRKNILKKCYFNLARYADIKTLNKRVKFNQKRPLLNRRRITEKILKKLYDERKKIYNLANHKIAFVIN